MLAGATAVQIGTASYADPRAVERIAVGVSEWCQRHHADKIASLTGSLDVTVRQPR
jgi:dihydroorotate dehydrogenase (NAD+) catalytic subunit